MKYPSLFVPVMLLMLLPGKSFSQDYSVQSPDKQIQIEIHNGDHLSYAVSFNGKAVVNDSPIGFEFKNEPSLGTGLKVIESRDSSVDVNWVPAVPLKHDTVVNHYNEIYLQLKEIQKPMRRIDVWFRAYNDGIAFRTRLFRGEKIGNRIITKETTEFDIPGNPKAWAVQYGGYSTSNEAEFMEQKLSDVKNTTVAGMPLLMELDTTCWAAITEADIDNYAAFYIGTNGQTNHLTTKLSPLPGEKEKGAKVISDKDITTPWRVIMIGNNPGTLIQSELVRNLNSPSKIKDPSWIKPGMCAWDNWWSGDVKMEMPVIKKYIDLASTMGWPYMLVDWQWYGPFNTPEADITHWAPQLDMPEIIRYAKERNVRIILWLYSSDVNRNSAFEKTFPLYEKWGVAGIKIDFMDRDDQEMVKWYRTIIQCAAKNHLLVDFHGAYKPDGIMRTYPNMITREGVMGNEYYKFSNKMSPEHNVKLAFTRMLAGPMDYTPGGFLNVTQKQFKQQTPTVVANTRAAELSKFVIYESPLTVVCDAPEHILNQPGADFITHFPTVWDDTRFLGGYPGDYVAIARRHGDVWYVGVMNNSKQKEISLSLNFLPEGKYEAEIWADGNNANTNAADLRKETRNVKHGEVLKIKLANAGGWVARIKKMNTNR